MYTGFGAFLSPLHDPAQDPHLTLRRDLELVEYLDELNFDECWFGEHHSLGWPTIGAPETVIAAAAGRTRQIKLANGVVTVPFHHPFHIATRAILLDHLTRGRYILGMGPGATPNDARMLGLDLPELKRMLGEALPSIMELVNGEERVTDKTDWYRLQDAKMQFPRYSRPGIEMALSSVGSPNSPVLAGKYGLGLLSFGAPPPGYPVVDLARQWAYAEESAAEHGRSVDRRNWRIAVPLYVAESREEAFRDAREGFGRWLHNYWGDGVGLDVTVPGAEGVGELEATVERGGAIVGSVDDAIEAIARLQETTGGFGTFLVYVMNWASWEKTKRSFELLARYVAPHFTGTGRRAAESIEWSIENRLLFPHTAASRAAAQAGSNSD